MPEPLRASIITGAGRGLGRAIARRLAQSGPVALVGRTQADLDRVAAEIAADGGQSLVWVGDVADPRVPSHVRDLVERHGWEIAHLICNAGITRGGPTDSFSMDDWRAVFETNVHGAFAFVRECLPAMVANKRGTIVLMSSVAGVRGYKYEAAYTASKYALVGLAKVLAQEYGREGIVAVPICPGFADTEATQRTVRSIAEKRKIAATEAAKWVASASPQRRLLPPEEVAEAVALVCSGALPSLSGNPLILSGGE